MNNPHCPYQDLPLNTREDLAGLAKKMISASYQKLSPGKAFLQAGETSSRYPDSTAWLEGFLRPVFGLAPLSAGSVSDPEIDNLWDICRQGIISGTDPASPEYWGPLNGREQKVVEMTTLGLALSIVPDKIWEPLSNKEKKNLEQWLLLINDVPLAVNNWLFFPVIVNLGLKHVQAAYSPTVIETALSEIEKSYLSNGWYSDGPTLQRDYYVPFAMHFYGLIYARLMEKEDPKRACLYRDRAAEFAKDFLYWFSSEGDALPYGRSLTYRFAMSAFWSALAYSGVEALPWGVIKGIILRNIRWWMKQPVFDSDGLLTIGYRYPNLKMAEFYNAPGSPAWAMKAFLILALPAAHPFWTAKEEPLPSLNPVSVQKHPFMIFMRDQTGEHIQALTSGQYASFEPTFMAAKYEKFAYSNVFGFSVPGGDFGLEQGAFDSMLALCEKGDTMYRCRRRCEQTDVRRNCIYSVWKPWKDVTVHTWLIPCAPWHIRVHRIESSRKLLTGEGAYAVSCDSSAHPEADRFFEEHILETDHAASAFYPWAGSAVINLEGNRKGQIIMAHPNTNLLYSRTRIPTLTGELPAGETWLACAVSGIRTKDISDPWNGGLKTFLASYPRYERQNNSFTITYHGAVYTFTEE